MNDLLSLFFNNLFPILIIAGAGYLLSRATNIEPRLLSLVVFYLFSPCLVFNIITQSKLNSNDILRTMSLAASLIILVGGITYLLGKMLRLERRTLASVVLTSMFMNAGNYGLPVVLFALGETALGFASLFFVTSALLTYTLGVVIASMGTTTFRQALGNLIKIPTLYALVLALLFLQFGWQIPLPVERSIKLLGDASIPAMLVLLGMQFKKVEWTGKALPIALASGMRLLVSPAIVWILSPAFGLLGPALQANMVEAAMPSAVMNTVLATEYEVEPPLVAATVFITTLLSPFTLTPLLALLGA